MKKITTLLVSIILSISFALPMTGCSHASSNNSQTESKQLAQFTTHNLDGKEVTNDIFKDYDLTVINVWGTFCSPCIKEMPDLEEWNKNLPKNVQLIGLVSDIQDGDDTSDAKKIVDDTKVTYQQILNCDGLRGLSNKITAVPTTLFVNRGGEIVGDYIVGAQVNKYKQFVEEFIDKE